MRIKKILAIGTAGILAAALSVTPVSAHHGRHGGHHGQSRNTTAAAPVTCEVCQLEGCTSTGRHAHDGTTYCGYHHENGSCDGTCAALCTVDGCTSAERHVHDGITYCGYGHENGFCDSSCQSENLVFEGTEQF